MLYAGLQGYVWNEELHDMQSVQSVCGCVSADRYRTVSHGRVAAF